MPALELIGELLVVDPQHVKHSRMKIMNLQFVFNYVVTKVICFTVGMTTLNATASHP